MTAAGDLTSSGDIQFFGSCTGERTRSMLAEKIEGELAVVIRHLLTRFADRDEARRLLYEQQKSEEALAIKREGIRWWTSAAISWRR